MARQCKCCVTQEIGTTDTFIKINGKYYKNQEVYDADHKRKEDYRKLIDYISYELLGYGDGNSFPPSLPKKLKDLSFYDYDVILRTFQKCHDDILYSFDHKEFKNEYNKISYMFAIIKDKIGDVYKECQRQQQQETQMKKTEIECSDISNLGTKTAGKDISGFLDDDEL
jgi:hypothetical protein